MSIPSKKSKTRYDIAIVSQSYKAVTIFELVTIRFAAVFINILNFAFLKREHRNILYYLGNK